jgi:hypothetical protein
VGLPRVATLSSLVVLVLLGCHKEPTRGAGRNRPEIQRATLTTAVRGRDLTSPKRGEPFVIRLARTACYGYCPVYQIEIRADGRVDYVGEANVKVKGKATHDIPAADVAALVRKLDGIGFFGLTWDEQCPGGLATDNASAEVTLVLRGRKRVLDDYQGNRCVPPELRELETEIDRVASARLWTACPTKDGHCYDTAGL